MVFSFWFAGDMLGACYFTLQLFARAIELLAPYARPDNPNQAEWETAGSVLGWLMRGRGDFLIHLGLPDQALAEAKRHYALAQALPPGNTQTEHLLMSGLWLAGLSRRSAITRPRGSCTAYCSGVFVLNRLITVFMDPKRARSSGRRNASLRWRICPISRAVIGSPRCVSQGRLPYAAGSANDDLAPLT